MFVKLLDKMLARLEYGAQRRREARANPDPLSAAMFEVRRDELMELAAALDLAGEVI